MDNAKIKVPFYTTDIDILHVASMHHIVIHRIDISIYIDESLHLYGSLSEAYVYSRTRSLSNYTLFDNNLVQCLCYFSPEVMTDNTVFIIG